MINFRLISSLFVVALMFSACTSDSPVSVNEQALTSDAAVESTAATVAMSGKMATRPFKGSVDAETIVADGPYPCMVVPELCEQRCRNAATPPTWVIGFSAQGNATHLGRFQVSAEHCSDVEFDVDTMLPVSAVYGDGEFEIVAANGDRIVGTYGSYGAGGDGSADTIAPGVADFHDRVIMTGGTGRFTNVSGTLQEDGLFLVTTGAITQWTMHGEIRYAASDRSGR